MEARGSRSSRSPGRSPGRPRAWFLPRTLDRFLERSVEMRPVSLRFVDPSLERAFQVAYFRESLPYLRLAHVMGIVLWAVFGFLADIEIAGDLGTDLVIRYGIAVPVLVISLGVTYLERFPRMWRQWLSFILLVNAGVWSTHRVLVPAAPADWAYAGLMVVLAFCYILSRLPFTYSSILGAAMIAYHNVVSYGILHDSVKELALSDSFLLSIAMIGMAAAYGLERTTRLVFLRERQLDGARRRADDLLRNTLPGSIVDRLQAGDTAPEAAQIADGLESVTVLFADLVRFTEHAARVAPHELVVVLDDVFTQFDELADRVGMEKIKTVGDAYMAVAGAPDPRPDHARAAAEMALGILVCLEGARWPTGGPMDVRIGMASGPVVAGVIGRRKFAYDLWGDTVNVASRLESHGEPGRILVAESTYELLIGRYEFSESRAVELKGKGPTRARFLLKRSGEGDPD
jgi:class 3 adenylate cyclase